MDNSNCGSQKALTEVTVLPGKGRAESIKDEQWRTDEPAEPVTLNTNGE